MSIILLSLKDGENIINNSKMFLKWFSEETKMEDNKINAWTNTISKFFKKIKTIHKVQVIHILFYSSQLFSIVIQFTKCTFNLFAASNLNLSK